MNVVAAAEARAILQPLDGSTVRKGHALTRRILGLKSSNERGSAALLANASPRGTNRN